MSLEFRPFVAINPNETSRTQKSMEQLNQTFNNVGNQALQYRQQQIENARQQQLMDIQKQQAQQQMDANRPLSYYTNNYQSENGQSMQVPPDYQGASPSGSLQQGTTGSQPTPVSTPNYQDAQGNQSVQGTAPINFTNSYHSWRQANQPSQWQHPELQAPQNPIAQAHNPMQQQGGFDWNTYSNLPAAQAGHYAEGMKLQAEMPGGMNSKFAQPQQVRAIFGKGHESEADALSTAYNGNVPQQILSDAATNVRFGSSTSRQQEEYDRTEGAKIGNEINSLTTSGRSALGVAARNKTSLQQYKALLSDPKATNEELNAVIQGVDGILGADHTGGYKTAAGKWNSIKTYLTSNPQAINEQGVRQQIINNIDSLTNLSDSIVNRNARTVKAAHAPWIAKYPDQWSNMLSTIQPEQGAGASDGSGTGQPKTYQYTATDAEGNKRGWDGSKWVSL